MAEPAPPNPSPSILTLRVHHKKTSFTATFRTRITAGSTHEPKCTCYRIHQIWLGADNTDDASRRDVLLPETPQKTTVLRFVFRSATNTEKARGLCALSQEPSGTELFRKDMHELLTALVALCEAEHLSDKTKSRSLAGSALRPFRTSKLDRNTVSEELRAKMVTPLAISEVWGQGMGYVYILRSRLDISTLSVLKIGFSKYHPEHRAQELASCLAAPELVAHTPLIPHAKRIESLIHTELVAKRRIQACGQCGQEHREWFTISHAESREVVIRWSQWILRQPYLDGKLSARWQAYLQEQDFASASPDETVTELWDGILDGFPRRETDLLPEKQLVAYLNACYYEDLGRRVMGPLAGSFTDFNDTLRDGRSGEPLEGRDFLGALDKLVSSDFDVETGPGIKPCGSSKPGFSAGSHDFDTWKKELRQEMEAVKNLTTGGFSVSDPVQGVTESPLGDATLLPVMSLKTLGQMDAPARNWVGYNPTHEGFQFLQEAYQRGEWVGNIPQFRLPRAFRKAGVTKLSTEAGDRAEASANTSKPSGSSRGRTARFTRSEDADTWEFSAEINDDFKKEMNEMRELMKFPMGRALLEKEALRSFRHLGLDFAGGFESGALSTSSESSDDGDKMSIDEPQHMEPESSTRAARPFGREPASVSTSTSEANTSLSSGLAISKARAKRWLESI